MWHSKKKYRITLEKIYRVSEAERMSVSKLKPPPHSASVFVAVSKEISVPILKNPIPVTPDRLNSGLFSKLMPVATPK
ncbi:hypothetical protein H5410_018039 [Solanum commersonii]|uniref:Uncharacterized protein n=1 Tax=Solanum commersonii TaxID=4109 RepID=A0A9J6A262_SOLCO|nr:hypothetical protein H5410_018039 [Solanum commersonii]